MTFDGLLDLLRTSGISVALDGAENVRINAPKGALTAEIRDSLRLHKPSLLNWLRESQSDDGAALPLCTPDPEKRYEPFPMSDLQVGFYMANDPFMEFHVRPHYYVEKDLFDLDVDRYEAAWNKALHRHRNELVKVLPDGQLQTLKHVTPLKPQVIDLRDSDLEQVQVALSKARAQMMRSELPIAQWPWLDLRVCLWVQQDRQRARILYNHNNFFSDGYGTTKLLQEIDRYYADPGLQLPDIELSFRDAVLALEDLAASNIGQKARRYWEGRLSDLPQAVPLPLVGGMDRRCRSKLQRREGFLDAKNWKAFKHNAQSAGLTPSSAVFAVYAEVLASWSNCEHFVVSNMMTRRLPVHPDMQQIVGNFASLYPLEVDLRARESFQDSARRLQEQVIRDGRHLQWGGMQVMQALNRQRQSELGRSAVPFVVGSGLFMEGFERSDFSCLETSQVLLDHQFWELPDGRFYCVWDLLEAFFPVGMVNDMEHAYQRLLRQLADNTSAWAQKHFDLLPPWQLELRRQTAVDWAASAPHQNLGELLNISQCSRPDAVAVIDQGGSKTYAKLAGAARNVASALFTAGVGPGDRVAVMAHRGAAWLAALHGIHLAGAAYVPMDPALPAQRCAVVFADSGARVVLCGPGHAERDWPQNAVLLHIETVSATEAALDFVPAGTLLGADDLAYLIYTSGSTGAPKGVAIDHRGVLNTVLDVNQRFAIGPGDRLFGVSSIGFDLSVYDVFGAAAAAACVVYPNAAQTLNTAHWVELMAEHGVTVWNSAPPLAKLLVDMAQTLSVTLPQLRLVLLSGDWIPLDLPNQLRHIAPNARIISLGGATEASIWSIWHEIEALDPSWPSIPYGRPMRNQTWYVLDEHGNEAAVWVPGALFIGGAGLAKGYWNDPAKTAAAFVEHPVIGERLYRTGDMGRYHPDGLIEFLGRRDAQVKIQGHRIELGEIETVLLTHQAVVEAVVVVQPSAGSGAAQLAAHLVCRNGESADAATLKAHLASRLPGYMVPALFDFLPSLPLSSSGKVDRRALALLTAQSATESPDLRPPRSDIETQLLQLWSRVLGREIQQVGPDFFDSGGQSYEAVQLAGLMQHAFGMRVSLGDLWQHRGVEQQAALVAAQGVGTQSPLRAIATHHPLATPLYLVHPAGGNVLCYRHLAKYLRRPVWAFEADTTGLHDGVTVQALAKQYLAALPAGSQGGKLLLGGWSSGGPIAFEMAAQLQSAGHQVEGIVIMDSPAPHPTGPIGQADLLSWFVEDIGLSAQTHSLGVSLAHDLAKEALTHLEQLTLLAQRLSPYGAQLPADVEALAEVYQTFETMVRATAAYVAPVVDVPVLVLRATQGQVSEFVDHPHADTMAWGWHLNSRMDVTGTPVPATHLTLLEPGTAPQCATHIEDWIGALYDNEKKPDLERVSSL
jgi:pyochelin synthetase